jgi:hypothetical protein
VSDDLETRLADDEALVRLEGIRPPKDTAMYAGNPALAPRVRTCSLCKEVQALEDVAIRLYDEKGRHLRTKPVAEYLRSIGMGGTPQAVYNRIVRHRKHIDAWLTKGAPVVPMQVDEGISRIPAPTGPTSWIDAQQNAIDLGNEALRDLAAQLASGAMETPDVIALAKLGVSAANTRGAMEQKGKALNSIDQLLRLAAGGMGKTAEGGPG